jgi:hypothetical protein
LQKVYQPLAAFRASIHGRDVQSAAGLDRARIRLVRLMIAARQAGLFAIKIRRRKKTWTRVETRWMETPSTKILEKR